MILDTPERIAACTAAGWWGTDTIDDLFRRAVTAHPDRTAVVDPPNRADLTVGEPTRWTYAELATRVERLAAWLVARMELSLKELRRFLDEIGVAAYKIPRELAVIDALPRNPLGKVLKDELRASFEGKVPVGS